MALRQLRTADRGRAIAWLQDGATQRNVAQRLHVSQSVIGRLWLRLTIDHFLEDPDQPPREKTGTLSTYSHCQTAP